MPLMGDVIEQQDPVLSVVMEAMKSAHSDREATAALALRTRLERHDTFVLPVTKIIITIIMLTTSYTS